MLRFTVFPELLRLTVVLFGALLLFTFDLLELLLVSGLLYVVVVRETVLRFGVEVTCLCVTVLLSGVRVTFFCVTALLLLETPSDFLWVSLCLTLL